MSNLQFSKVVFDEDKHQYWLGDHQLKGVTKIVKDYICKGKYDGISQETLEAAAARGKSIHKEIELMLTGFPILDKAPEIDGFIRLQLENNINFIESEYLVTDKKHFASSIDIVDSNYNLYDIKTTYELDTEYLSWQLSIYAYLFELQNGFAAGKLYGIWLRDKKAKLVEVQKIDKALIESLLQAAAANEEWEKPENTLSLTDEQQKQLATLAQIEDAIIELDRQKDELADKKKQLCEFFKELMDANAVTRLDTEKLRITRVADSEKTMVDSDKLKKDGIYENYTKKVATKGYVKITIKKEENEL